MTESLINMRNPDASESADIVAWLTVSAAHLAGLVLSLVTLWTAAIPRQVHEVSLDMANECPEFFEQQLIIHSVVIDSANRITWDGQALDSRAIMEASMKTAAAKNIFNKVAVRIESHRLADYGSFIAVLASAQRNGIARVDVMGGERSASAWLLSLIHI